QLFCRLYRRAGRCFRRNRQQNFSYSSTFSYSVFQLRIIQASRVYMAIRFCPVGISLELCPKAETPILRSRRLITLDQCRSGLPEHTICSCPSLTFPILSTVFVAQRLCIDVYNIKQYTRSPAINRATKAIWFYCLALYESIRSCGCKPNSKIMIPFFGIQSLDRKSVV